MLHFAITEFQYFGIPQIPCITCHNIKQTFFAEGNGNVLVKRLEQKCRRGGKAFLNQKEQKKSNLCTRAFRRLLSLQQVTEVELKEFDFADGSLRCILAYLDAQHLLKLLRI